MAPRGTRDLEKALRANRPKPSDGFLQLAAGKIEVETPRRRNRRHFSQPLAILLAGGTLVGFILAFGGLSGVGSSLRPGGQLFAAANVVYAAPTLHCTIQKASGNHVTVSGTTTLAQGNISVTFSVSPAHSGYSQTKPTNAVTSTSWGPITSTGTAQVDPGHTYTATVTQTATGYAAGSTTCSFST